MKLKLGLLCTAALLLAAPSAKAVNLAMDGFTGLSVFGNPCPLCDSLVNFAVYESTDSDWTDDPFFSAVTRTDLADLDGSWGASVDSGAKYVYMYQPVNMTLDDNQLDNAINTFNISINPPSLPLITGAGYFGGVFIDEFGNTVDFNPDRDLDHPDYQALAYDVPNDHTPNRSTEGTQGLTTTTTPIFSPTTVRTGNLITNAIVNGGAPSQGVVFSYGGVGIPTGSSSSTIFLTSDQRPGYNWAETESAGGTGAVGDVPAPVPVPAGAVLLGSGIAIAGLYRRFWQKDTAKLFVRADGTRRLL